ncbi:hypothetical protein Mgra_00005149 [Meloidogyne graminicola]|uniref:Uncharacterized protein n=1 Tax=Meloidogyne graminicola TaxID=189291 RepID=A0A8S9ZPU5_9BILA|nr:hypothetical protein Mgra_00005149 [Meloidogyne graminicola]
MSEEINTKLRINIAALISPLVAIFQLLDTSCILNKLKPDVQRHGLYTYYIEMPNGSRMRQMADVVYDDRQVQFYFFHGFLIVFVLPGFFMPYLLYLAEKRQKPELLIWWVCWITLHNVHAIMQISTYILNFAMLIYLKGFEHFICFDYWNLLNICQLGSTINSFGVPLKIYLSIFMIKHYQNIKNISPKASKMEAVHPYIH